jgi:hypothetical protein
MRRFHVHVGLVALLLAALSLPACDDDDDYPYYDECRFEPGLCAGGLGGLCGGNQDCAVGFCCRNPKECGGGMCTLSCRNDLDCPVEMACEHGMCFYSCRSDLDCAAGQHCGHGHTVCEW